MEPDTPKTLDPATEAALKSLQDIVVPAPVSWMPQTWGWALLASIVVLAIVAYAVHRARVYRANAYRRAALVILDGMEDRLAAPATRDQAMRELAEILKRVALAGWSRPDVASLSCAAWVRFLEDHGGEAAGHALNTLLDDGEYQGGGIAGATASGQMVSEARNWIRRHDVSA